jgi:hypothetical protein
VCAVAPSLRRRPYGHVEGAISVAVDAPGGLPTPDLVALLRAAAEDWTTNLVGYAAEVGYERFERRHGGVDAIVLEDTLDGPVVVAAGRDDIEGVPWPVLTAVATAVGRHLHQAGYADARVVKPATRTLPGRVWQVPEAVILRAVPRPVEPGARWYAEVGRLVDAARRWVEQIDGPVYALLGLMPVSCPSGVPDALAALLARWDVHFTMAAGVARQAVALAELGGRALALGWGGRAVGEDERQRRGEQLARVMGDLATALDYGCVSYDDVLWPIENPTGAVPGWHGTVDAGRTVADAFVLDAFWAQLLSDEHLAHAPTAAAQADSVGPGRHVLRVGPPQDWLAPAGREARREAGRRLLGGCLVERRFMDRLGREAERALWAQRPLPRDPAPAWALPVTPPDDMSRSYADARVHWVGPGLETYREGFSAPDGREVDVEQESRPTGPSPGNDWTDIAPGLRVQEIVMSHGDRGRGVFWSEHGRTLHVMVNEAALADLVPMVLALHHAGSEAPAVN